MEIWNVETSEDWGVWHLLLSQYRHCIVHATLFQSTLQVPNCRIVTLTLLPASQHLVDLWKIGIEEIQFLCFTLFHINTDLIEI